MQALEVTCGLCGEPVDPLDRHTWRRVVGWERKAIGTSRKSGSDIALREPRDEYAHAHCVRLHRSRVHVGQGTLV